MSFAVLLLAGPARVGAASAPQLSQPPMQHEFQGTASAQGWQDTSHSIIGKTFVLNPGFLCTKQENFRAMKAATPDLCILGVTKFGWAAVLTAASMVIIILCVPLILALSRRRPPGASFLSSCSSKPPLQFRVPPVSLPSHTSYASTATNPRSAMLAPSYTSTPSQTLLTQAMPDPQAMLSETQTLPAKPVFSDADAIRFP